MAERFARANGVGMRRVGSTEWRWVSQEVNDAEEEEEAEREEGQRRGDMESEEEDEGEQKLIRTSPRIDWFDVEALEVTGVQKNEDEEFDLGRTMVLTLQTLGVVFGDVGTSPLYTFDMMFNKCPIHGDDDVIGALSLVLYTLILIPLIKYVLVVLWGNDDGEEDIPKVGRTSWLLRLHPATATFSRVFSQTKSLGLLLWREAKMRL